MRYIIVKIILHQKVAADIGVTGQTTLVRQRIDLKRISMLRECIDDDCNFIGTMCFDKHNEFLFTIDIPFEAMNTILNNYQKNNKFILMLN